MSEQIHEQLTKETLAQELWPVRSLVGLALGIELSEGRMSEDGRIVSPARISRAARLLPRWTISQSFQSQQSTVQLERRLDDINPAGGAAWCVEQSTEIEHADPALREIFGWDSSVSVVSANLLVSKAMGVPRVTRGDIFQMALAEDYLRTTGIVSVAPEILSRA